MSTSATIYFDKLQNYEMAYQIYNQALATDPNNFGHIANFAEANLATERYEQAYALAQRALRSMRQRKITETSTSLAMRFISVASLTLKGDEQGARRALEEFVQQYNSAGSYERNWTYTGSESFIRNAKIPDSKRDFLLKLLTVLKEPSGQIAVDNFK